MAYGTHRIQWINPACTSPYRNTLSLGLEVCFENRSWIEKEITQISPSHQNLFVSTYLSHPCAILCTLCPWHPSTFLCAQVNLHNGSYMFYFSVFIFPLSSLCLCILHYLSQLFLQRVLVPKVGIASPKHSTSHKRSI